MASSITNITDQFAQLYIPNKALLFYRHVLNREDVYIEKFSCNRHGRLVNAHPLSEREMGQLAALFARQRQTKERYLQCDGLLPDHLLYMNAAAKTAIWYTPPQSAVLHFTRSLHLASGSMQLPALLWKASDSELFVYALTGRKRPTVETELFHGPFFNLYGDGRVCMGTVQVNFTRCKNIQEFTGAWQAYFFNSKFSHLIGDHYPTRTPLPDLYRQLLAGQTPFPEKELISTKRTLQNILP